MRVDLADVVAAAARIRVGDVLRAVPEVGVDRNVVPGGIRNGAAVWTCRGAGGVDNPLIAHQMCLVRTVDRTVLGSNDAGASRPARRDVPFLGEGDASTG